MSIGSEDGVGVGMPWTERPLLALDAARGRGRALNLLRRFAASSSTSDPVRSMKSIVGRRGRRRCRQDGLHLALTALGRLDMTEDGRVVKTKDTVRQNHTDI